MFVDAVLKMQREIEMCDLSIVGNFFIGFVSKQFCSKCKEGSCLIKVWYLVDVAFGLLE